MIRRFSFLALVVAMIVFGLTSAFGQTEKVLWSFGNTPADGAFPTTSLARDKTGNLYGTTELGGSVGQGTIFELSPQADGTYTEGILFNFCANYVGQQCLDGFQPNSLIADASGNLYGTNYMGGPACPTGQGVCGGTVFRLSPPQLAGGAWTYTVLYDFCSVIGNDVCLDGSNPHGRLTFDASGNLYGTATFGGNGHLPQAGVAFELSPNSNGTWSEAVLYNFCSLGTGLNCPDGASPQAGVTFDKSGNLYGTTELSDWIKAGEGLVYKLSPSQGGWQETALIAFTGGKIIAPVSEVVFDNKGNLYSTGSVGSFDFGSVFRLKPNGMLNSFIFEGNNGYQPSGLLIDPRSGSVYGTTLEGGASSLGNVYKIGTNGKLTVIYEFCQLKDCVDGSLPAAGLITDNAGNGYGTTETGGRNNSGVVYEITAE